MFENTPPGFVYSILSNRTLIVVEECLDSDDGCSSERYVLELKTWLHRGERINNMLSTMEIDVGHNTSILHEIPFWTRSNQSLTDELSDASKILRVRFDETHYGETNWKDYASQIHSRDRFETQLEKLYSNGIDFLYGLLFHEIFSIHDGYEPSWEESSTMNPTTIVLELAENDENYNVPSIQNCVNSIVSSDYASTGSDIKSPDCHIFAISNRRYFNESKFGRYIENQRLEDDDDDSLHMAEHNCSITYVPFPSTPTTIDTTTSIGKWWRNADLVSHARSGRIQPSNNNNVTQQEITAQRHVAARFVKERIEYRRYVETWKMGRDPFVISELERCDY